MLCSCSPLPLTYSQSKSSDKFLQILAVPLHDLGDIDPDDGDNDNEQDDDDPELDCVE